MFVKKQNAEMCEVRFIIIICDQLYENRTYESISNFEKEAKINSVSNMASQSTVSISPFASKRCFLIKLGS